MNEDGRGVVLHVLLSEFEIPKGVIAKDQKFQSSVLKVTVIFFN